MTSPGAAAVRWVSVTRTWLGFRPEPFVHERLWACPLVDVGHADPEGWTYEAGFDAQHRPVALQVQPPGERARLEAETVYGDGEIRVFSGGDLVVTTVLDDQGRPLTSTYTEGGREAYRYDQRGRLVGIDEAEGLWGTAIDGVRDWTGGTLDVEYDDQTAVRITSDEGGVVWERIDDPWEATLATGAEAIAAGVITAVADAIRDSESPPELEVFELCLVYVDQGSLRPMVAFGLESERRRWLESDIDTSELAARLWYPFGRPDHPLGEIDEDVLSAELDSSLLREATLKQPEDPYRAVLDAAAARLSRHDWSDLLTTTEDFVVFIAEHDEGYGPKHASVRAVNPPERVALWDARWPTGVPRDD